MTAPELANRRFLVSAADISAKISLSRVRTDPTDCALKFSFSGLDPDAGYWMGTSQVMLERVQFTSSSRGTANVSL